ncbi:hypothetical protein AB4043_23135, partial [Terriglobus sp. YAF25]|uniref:hypothetical protein n=1 Tax=Terriglobus sp. YAF25 TaxID=3233080 RepID=UPI003F976D8E
AFSLWVRRRASASMGVFRNENATAHLFRNTQQQGKRSSLTITMLQGHRTFARFHLLFSQITLGASKKRLRTT